MKNIIVLILLFTVTLNIYALDTIDDKSSLKLTQQEKVWIDKKIPIKYVFDPDWAPFEWKNGLNKHTGIISDIIKLLSKKTGIVFEAIPTKSWNESIELVESNKADMFSAITYNDERAKYLQFSSNAIFQYSAVLISKSTSTINYQDDKNLINKKIGVTEGSALTKKIKKEYLNSKFINIESTTDGFEKVRNAEIDLLLINAATGSYYIAHKKYNDTKVARVIDYTFLLKIALSKKMPSEVLSIIDKGLDSIEEEQIQGIYDKWTSLIVKKETDWTLLFQIVGVITIILLFILYINRKLKKIIKERTDELSSTLKVLDKQLIVSKTNNNGILIYCNDNMLKTTGYLKNELIGKPYNILRHPDTGNEIFKDLWNTIKAGKIWKGDIKNIKKDGTPYWVDTLIEPVLNQQGKILSYTSTQIDITDKINLNELIKNQKNIIYEQTKNANIQKDKAIKANKAKSEFLANMSHEIRTPLNAIMGFVELLVEQEQDETKVEYLKTINNSSKSLMGVINDILDFSKIESGKFNIEYIDFNPIDELDSTKNLFIAKCKEKNINLHTNFINLPNSLNGDILRIKQILNNLLSNAVKFTSKDKNIYLIVEYKDSILHVSVRDEGIGISKEYQEHIFDAFTQEDSSTTRKYGGTGLGLTISYNILKMMNSELKVRGEQKVGSEFYFSIALKIGKEIKFIEQDNSKITLQGHILLAEDNKTNQVFMKVILKQMNLTVDIANDGLEAVSLYKDNHTNYSAILMDENMPNMNGREATKQILKYEKENRLKHIPIIALTANALKGDRERFLEAGMDEYLTKPLDKKKLSEVLKKNLNNKKETDK